MACALVACGGSDGEASGGAGGIGADKCAPGEFRLEGGVEGTSVDRVEPTAGSGFAQGSPGSFDSSFGGMPRDPNRSALHLEWDRVLAYGERAPARGTLVLAEGLPRAGEQLCVGSGSSIGFSERGQLHFTLQALAAAADCSEPVVGTLAGCWESTN